MKLFLTVEDILNKYPELQKLIADYETKNEAFVVKNRALCKLRLEEWDLRHDTPKQYHTEKELKVIDERLECLVVEQAPLQLEANELQTKRDGAYLTLKRYMLSNLTRRELKKIRKWRPEL